MPNVEELKAEIKKEIMPEVRNGISELRDSLNKHIDVENNNNKALLDHLKEIWDEINELSGRRKR